MENINKPEPKKDKMVELRGRYNELFLSLLEDEKEDFIEKINDKVKDLKGKYKDTVSQYASYYVLTEKKFRENASFPQQDFPGEDSVEKFLEKLAEDYSK